MSATSFPNRTADDAAGVPVFADPLQTRLNVKLTTACIVEAFVILALAAVLFGMWYRGPISIITRQTPTGDEVISYNGRPVTNPSNSITVGPDSVTEGNRTFIARQYVAQLYGSDAGNRAANVQSALRLMVDSSAEKLMTCIKARGCPEYNLDLDTKRREAWQEQWSEQELQIDPRDGYTIHIIGQYKVTKVINQQVYTESKQLRISLKMVADPDGRTDRNLQNGVRVFSYDYKELNNAQ